MEYYTNSALHTWQLEPYVAEEDIRVFQKLFEVKNKDGTSTYYPMPLWKYEVPTEFPKMETTIVYLHGTEEEIKEKQEEAAKHGFQYVRVEQEAVVPNSLMKPNNPNCIVVGQRDMFRLHEGIVSCVKMNCATDVFKAYIPKGTKYFVDNDLQTVFMEALFITDQHEHGIHFNNKDEWNRLLKPIEDSISKDTVSSGWYVLKDGSFLHPSEYTKKRVDDIMGVVVGERQDELVVVSSRCRLFEKHVDGIENTVQWDGKQWHLPTRDFMTDSLWENVIKVGYAFNKYMGCTPLSSIILCYDDGAHHLTTLLPYREYDFDMKLFNVMYFTKILK